MRQGLQLSLILGLATGGWICSAAPGASSADEPLFPRDSVAVILAGLAGDAETERVYSEQARAWAELASGPGCCAEVFVLTSAGESSGLAGPRVRVFPAERKQFLTVGSLLRDRRGPLVVVAFGHAGVLGDTPVLHVRGPRLTPSDFSSFAKEAGGESRWILMFRGSGEFAARLAAPQRQALSSDNGTGFGSDPVGNGILLKCVEANPALPFERVAADFGRRVAAWYAQRRLARTEEPALWLGASKPGLLASSAVPVREAQRREAEPAEVAKSTSAAETLTQADAKGGEAAAGAGTRGFEGWQGITRVSAGSHPGSDAVILKQRLHCALGGDGSIATEQDQFIQVLTPAGKELGDFDIAYCPPEEELEFVDCEIQAPDGKISRLQAEKLESGSEPSAGDYTPMRRKSFSLPGVVPGAVLHVRYRREFKKFPLPRASFEVPVGGEAPILESTVEVSVPAGTRLHFAFADVAAPDAAVTKSTYSTTYQWNFHGLPARRRDALVAPHRQPRLQLSTFEDWREFAGWYQRISRLTDEITPALRAKAEALTRDCRTETEKIHAVYDFVTGLRYVAIPLGVNSFRPHAAANVLENGFGDCKDKANLFNTLLHALNIDAQLVLVPRFGQAREDLPGLAFNHAISRVLSEGKPLWVDTTDGVCRFGSLPPGDPGRNVLVLDGKEPGLTQLPTPVARDHTLALHGWLESDPRADGWPVRLALHAAGSPDYEFRSVARQSRSASQPLLSARYRPVAGSFALEKQEATAFCDLDQNFSWEATGRWVGFCSRHGSATYLHSPFWLPREWDLALDAREAPLFLNAGFPLTLDEEFEVALPKHAQAAELPAAREQNNVPLRWRVAWSSADKGKLAARLHVELARGELSSADTRLFQGQLRALIAAMGADASMAAGPLTAN